MLKELEDYDWAEVFGEGGGGNCSAIKPSVPPSDNTTSRDTFSRDDVRRCGTCGEDNPRFADGN